MATTDPSAPRLAQLEHIDERWIWHHQVLLNLRQNLLKRRSTVGVASATDDAALAGPPDAGEHWEFIHQLFIEELIEPSKRLAEVDDALRRMRAGTYGTCELTGHSIPAKRLWVLPWTRFATAQWPARQL